MTENDRTRSTENDTSTEAPRRERQSTGGASAELAAKKAAGTLHSSTATPDDAPASEEKAQAAPNRDALRRYATAAQEQLDVDLKTPEGVVPYVSPKTSLLTRSKHYIRTRWYPAWYFYDNRAARFKSRYIRLQLFIALGSVTVPIMIGFNNLVPNWIPALLSGMVAAATAIENVQKNGDNWRAFRNAAEGLNREKVLYEAMAGPYSRSNAPFRLFVERSEDIIAEETGRYFERQQEEEADSEMGSTASGTEGA